MSRSLIAFIPVNARAEQINLSMHQIIIPPVKDLDLLHMIDKANMGTIQVITRLLKGRYSLVTRQMT